MVEIELPDLLNSEFQLLIPRQREYIKRMMSKGVIIDYSLSSDRKKLWVIVEGKDEKDITEVINSFPIINYVRYSINRLLFHDSSSAYSPQFWLN